MKARSKLGFSGDTRRCPLNSDETLFKTSLSPRPSSGRALLGTVPKIGNHTPAPPPPPPEMSQTPPATPKVRVSLSLGQFLDPPPPHPLRHPAARVWTRGTGGGAALSWDSARRLGFLRENTRNDVWAPEWWISRGRGAGSGEGRTGIRAGAAVQTPG